MWWGESYGFQGKRVLSCQLDSTMKVCTNFNREPRKRLVKNLKMNFRENTCDVVSFPEYYHLILAKRI